MAYIEDEGRRILTRPTREELANALALLHLPAWEGSGCIDFLQQLKTATAKNFRRLSLVHSVDKMASASVEQDPSGEDCGTLEKRKQAWTSRMQKLVEAREIIVAARASGVKEPGDEV